jgi:anti-sigma factor RsiW
VTHAPKTAALEALVAGSLSDEGRRRIDAHLQACEACRRELAAIQVYRSTLRDLAQQAPRMDWGRMELALAREARVQAAARRRRPAALWVGAGLVTAAAVALVYLSGVARESLGVEGAPIATRPRGGDAPAVEPGEGPTLVAGVVSMVVGGASVGAADGTMGPARVGARITGGALQTSGRSQLHVVLDPDDDARPMARVALGPAGRFELGPRTSTSGVDPVRLETRLVRGRATVDAFESDARVIVLAGAYRVEIRAARCTIDLASGDGSGEVLEEARTRVSVSASDPALGEVRVLGPDGEAHLLTGPSGTRSWGSNGEPALLDELAPAPFAGALLQLEHPDAVRFEVGGQAVEGGPSLAMRVAPGLISIRAFEADGRELRGEVWVGPEGLALTPDALQPIRPRIQGYLSPDEITPVVRQSQRGLQRCYEQALRLHPDLGGGLLRARVTLDARGAVRRVQIEEDGVPPSLEACVRQEAAQWAFPPPGGPMSFELPLRFRANGP